MNLFKSRDQDDITITAGRGEVISRREGDDIPGRRPSADPEGDAARERSRLADQREREEFLR